MPLYNPASSAADHIADTDDAHDASAISIADSGGFTAEDNVEDALQEIYDTLDNISGGVGDTLALYVLTR